MNIQFDATTDVLIWLHRFFVSSNARRRCQQGAVLHPLTHVNLSNAHSYARYQPEDIVAQVVGTITALVLSSSVWREQAQSVGVIDALVKHMQLSMEPATITALSGAIEVCNHSLRSALTLLPAPANPLRTLVG